MPNARILVVLTVLLSVICGIAALAEEALPSQVGRISAANGAVSLRPAAGEWTPASINDPLITGMGVRTADRARAGVGIGVLRAVLAGGSEAEIARLDDTMVQIALKQGRIGIHIARLDPGAAVEIDLPQGAVWLLAAGDYDIGAGSDQVPSWTAVFAGQARFAGGGTDRTLAAGSALVTNSKGVVTAATANADDFVASWRPAADAMEPAALKHVSAVMTGWDALDTAGGWENAEGFGEVWVPKSVPDDWAPYRYGHWRWAAPWGWNWVDDMAWGFAPSHYGRWARIAGSNTGKNTGAERWAWVPAAQVAHPIYMPAAVNFIGSAGVGLSAPDPVGPVVAWFPLAPGEVYWPSYTSDLALIRRINAGVVKDVAKIGPGVGSEPPGELITAHYQNRRFATVVPRAVFAGGRAVAPAQVSLPPERLGNAPLLLGSPQIMPPASKPVVIATASAVHTLSRILTPQPSRAVARSTVSRYSRPGYTQAQTRSGFAARVAMSASRARARAVASYAHSMRTRTHLAAASSRSRVHY
jgi:hypothetical protein